MLKPVIRDDLRDYFAHYGGQERPMPEIAGQYGGRGLVICADGACIWDDLEALGCKSTVGRGKVRAPTEWDFMVVNKLGETFPGEIAHWYSNEPELMHRFIAARRSEYAKEFDTQFETHSCNHGAKWHWPFGGHGTSGCTAALVGCALGYDQVILCGMPLDNGPHNGEPPWRKSNFLNEAASPKDSDAPSHHWKRAIDSAFKGRVTSMSGRTREWLGSPML